MNEHIQEHLNIMASFPPPTACMERFVLDFGTDCIAQPLPAPFRKMPLGHCFENAHRLVMRHRNLRYVEGFAYHNILAIHHAWCVDEQNNVVDPTWEEPATCQYRGVIMGRRWFLKQTGRYTTYSYLDKNSGPNVEFMRSYCLSTRRRIPDWLKMALQVRRDLDRRIAAKRGEPLHRD